MEPIYDEQLLLFRELEGLLLIVGDLAVGARVVLAEGFVEPFLEFLAGGEDLGEQEVEEGPELTQVVLEGRPCEQDPMGGHVLLAEGECELALLVLHPVALIHDDVLPGDLAEGGLVVEDVLVGGDDHMELIILEVLSQEGPLMLLALVDDLPDAGGPLVELHDPVGDDREGHHNQERALAALALDEVREQGDGLDGLAQPHLVRQDPIQVIVEQTHHPVQPYHLVRLQHPPTQQLRLSHDLLRDRVRDRVVHLAPRLQVLLDLVRIRVPLYWHLLLLLQRLRRLVLCLLQVHLGPQLLQVLVGLLQDLEESLVLLGGDDVDVGRDVIALERLDPLLVLPPALSHELLLLLAQVALDELDLPLHQAHLLLVELSELLVVVVDLVEELPVPRLFPAFLPTPHLLLEPVQSPRLPLRTLIHLRPLVELPVHQLPLKELVPHRLHLVAL
mmetsp:Transcript_27928/g.26964  ORF Transcript_27928/g.26964 Transcript_27928/m.26964 type:complete len:446 (-) Transcript_27928:715-2052(-)